MARQREGQVTEGFLEEATSQWVVMDEDKLVQWSPAGGLYCLVSTIFKLFLVVNST